MMSADKFADRVDDSSLQQNDSSSDENESDEKFDFWEHAMKKAKQKIRATKFPKNTCKHCYWIMFELLGSVVYPQANCLEEQEFIDAVIPVYHEIHEIFLICRTQHGGRFCVHHFCIILEIVRKFIQKRMQITWAFPSRVDRMFNHSYISWLYCNGTESKSLDHQKEF